MDILQMMQNFIINDIHEILFFKYVKCEQILNKESNRSECFVWCVNYET
jgi:hypothetical protein